MSVGKSSTAFWLKFFTTAGIPTSDAADYAVIFTDNRIKEEMITDLTKEILNDVGIKLMGDVIAILKHAQNYISESNRTKAFENMVLQVPAAVGSTNRFSRTSPATRTLAHYLNKAQNERTKELESAQTTPQLRKNMASRLGPKKDSVTSPIVAPKIISLRPKSAGLEVPVPKVRRVLPEHEGGYKVILPKGITPKTKKILETGVRASVQSASVFERLGQAKSPEDVVTLQNASGKVKVTRLNMTFPQSSGIPSSIQQRLGPSKSLKRPATSSVDALARSDDGLEYQGVLKLSSAKRQAIAEEKRQELEKLKQEQARKLALYKKAKEAKSTEGILSPDAVAVKVPVSLRLGPQNSIKAEAQSTTVNSQASPALKVSRSSNSSSVFNRLGQQF